MSEMSGMNQGDNLEEIHAWIDGIPFSRPKKNIPRDFSDGVLMAEVLRVYYPRFVDVHNYISASSVAAKRDNWSTLNRKVLSKIDLRLSKEVINQLANAQQGVIEKVLMDLRNKIRTKDARVEKKSSNAIACEEIIKVGTEADIAIKDRGTNCDKNIREVTCSSEGLKTLGKVSSSQVSMTRNTKNLLGQACRWLVGWMWPFTVTPGNVNVKCSSNFQEVSGINSSADQMVDDDSAVPEVSRTGDVEDESEENLISRLAFLRLRQELQEKEITISKLNRKVSSLESAVKLKDRKIGNLAAQVSVPADSSAQNLRPHVMGCSISKLRSQLDGKSLKRDSLAV